MPEGFPLLLSRAYVELVVLALGVFISEGEGVALDSEIVAAEELRSYLERGLIRGRLSND